MAQQTAVEWFAKQVEENLGWYPKDIIEQAKQMEKEQIIRTWENGNLPTAMGRVLTAEQYYNETYGNNQNK